MAKTPFKKITDRIKALFAGSKRRPIASTDDFEESSLNSLPQKRKRFSKFKFDPKSLRAKEIAEHPLILKWTILVLVIFILAEISARTASLFLRPAYQKPPIAKQSQTRRKAAPPAENYGPIVDRNMFNVEGKIPEPFAQELLDCMSQAKPSTQKLQLHGTIVMSDEILSVALVQDEGSNQKIAVKKGDEIYGKYVVQKIDRKRICFLVNSSQDFEYIEIPDDNRLAGGPQIAARASLNGITVTGETEYVIRQDFLQKSLSSLPDILQTAKAVPATDPKTGNFNGFLVQSIEPTSPFAALGIRQGDILTGVNDIVLDNPGKGLEAFQKLRDSQKVVLEVIRGGQKVSINYDVK